MSFERKAVFALYLEDDPILNPEHSDLLTRLASECSLRMVRGKEEARAVLDNYCPTAILVLDAGITRPGNMDIANDLANLAWAGSTVILAGGLSGANEDDLMKTLDKAFGLPWKYCGRSREVTALKRNMAGKMDLAGGYALEAVVLGNVLPISVWYGASVSGHMEKGAVVVFTGYGVGKLGYVGDVNLEEGSKQCIVKMFEVV